MNKEVEKLVGDPWFLRYHAEYVKRREFNAFDVLRYAEYEIRHSNVMAWLLDPNETHGVGRALQAVEDFLDAADSDYTRINDYFGCLAFRPGVAVAGKEDPSS